MITAITLPLRVDRGAPKVTRVSITGIDLSLPGTSWHAQIRLGPETPGSPLLDLPIVTDGTVSGVRLAGVDTTGLLPVSYLDVQISGTAPFPPTILRPTADITLAWDMFVTIPGFPATKWFTGSVTVSGTVTKEAVTAPLVAVPLTGDSHFAIQFTAATASIGMVTIDQMLALVADSASYSAEASASAARAAQDLANMQLLVNAVLAAAADPDALAGAVAGAAAATAAIDLLYPLAPTHGVATGGETQIPAPANVPSASPWWARVTINGVPQRPTIDYTSDGSATLSLTFTLTSGDIWMVEQLRKAVA